MRNLAPAAGKDLLGNARSLKEASAAIESGQSKFGRWAVPGLLPEQGTAVLYGQSGTGKSFLAVHLALCLSGGLPWFEKAVRQGTIVYLVTEDRAGIEARAVAAARQIGLPIDDLCLEFLTPPPIHSDSWRDNLAGALKAIEVRQERRISAVILDTLGAAFGGNSQDDAASMTVATDRVEAIAERFGCLFLSVHHSGKDAERGMRGSQVLRDRSDAVITLTKAKAGTIGATVEKQRNGPIGQQVTFRLAPIEFDLGGHRIETCAVKDLTEATPTIRHDAPPADASAPSSTSATPQRLSRDTQAALDALKGLANGRGASVEAWRTSAYQVFGDRNDEAKRQAFYGARKRLLQIGAIAIDGDTVSFTA